MWKPDSADGTRSSNVPGPLTIYVAWHPKCPDGKSLAEGVYDWFRKPSRAVERAGSGIPVYYRSQPWEVTPTVAGTEHGFLRGISYSDAAVNVVIPIIDEHMVDEVRWRTWLYEMAQRHNSYEKARRRKQARPGPGVVLIPVQLHHSIAQLDPIVSGINAIRVDNWDDEDDGDDGRRARRRKRMRRYLVQTLVRTLREQREDQRDDLLPRSVFLSHAKGDRELGVGIAEKLRIKALASGQIDTFFDASQLEWGKPWLEAMTSAADERTAAFIAVFSDLYSTRYWCREEIRRARRPRTLDEIEQIRTLRVATKDEDEGEKPEDGKAAESVIQVKERIWWVQPIVIVDALKEDWTYVLPEMSGAPVVRWETEDDAAEILDRVMLEAFRSEVQVRHASLLAHQRMSQLEDLHFLTWVPDPHTLLEWAFGESEIRAENPTVKARKKTGRNLPQGLVIYPGHGLGQLDERQLNRYLGEKVTFQSIEEFANSPDPTVEKAAAKAQARRKKAERKASLTPVDELPLVALSVGDPDLAELYALGYGSEHLDDAVYRLVAALLAANCRLAYGGVIRSTPGFLESVVDAVVMVSRERQARRNEEGLEADVGARPQPPTMLHSFQAWDFYRFTKTEKRAELHGLTTFHNIEPPISPIERQLPADAKLKESDLVEISPLPSASRLPSPLTALYRARALTRMRLRVSEQGSALVAIGGKTYGWSGFAPGILEEICLTHRAGGDVFLLPEFGGAARAIASWILNDNNPHFDLLSFEHHLRDKRSRNPKFLEIVEGLQYEGSEIDQQNAEETLRAYYDYLHGLAEHFRSDLRKFLGLDPGNSKRKSWGGLNKNQLSDLMTTSSMGLVRHLLVQFVLPHLRRGEKRRRSRTSAD